ncbi:hypothetical protein BC830DRAFT_904524 [Chytriomyces sp. MP71]|nr:hypothetical protein BC830DRAFT_904524 [Chytriomyces sp. MP71]
MASVVALSIAIIGDVGSGANSHSLTEPVSLTHQPMSSSAGKPVATEAPSNTSSAGPLTSEVGISLPSADASSPSPSPVATKPATTQPLSSQGPPPSPQSSSAPRLSPSPFPPLPPPQSSPVPVAPASSIQPLPRTNIAPSRTGVDTGTGGSGRLSASSAALSQASSIVLMSSAVTDSTTVSLSQVLNASSTVTNDSATASTSNAFLLSALPTAPLEASSSFSGPSSNLGPILGGVLGTLVFLLVALAIWFWYRGLQRIQIRKKGGGESAAASSTSQESAPKDDEGVLNEFLSVRRVPSVARLQVEAEFLATGDRSGSEASGASGRSAGSPIMEDMAVGRGSLGRNSNGGSFGSLHRVYGPVAVQPGYSAVPTHTQIPYGIPVQQGAVGVRDYSAEWAEYFRRNPEAWRQYVSAQQMAQQHQVQYAYQ